MYIFCALSKICIKSTKYWLGRGWNHCVSRDTSLFCQDNIAGTGLELIWGSRAALRLVHWFWSHLIWAPKLKKGRKRKTNILHKTTAICNSNLESSMLSQNTLTQLIFLLILPPTMVVPRVDPWFGITLPKPKLEL